MKQFTPKTFNIPNLKGITTKTIEEHLKLYTGYVKNLNAIQDTMDIYAKDAQSNAYSLNEFLRRFSFEYNGMRNHEVYFSALEGSAQSLSETSELKEKINETWNSFDGWLTGFKNFAATTRGIGWAVLWYDRSDDRLLCSWIDEQHLGELNGCDMILSIDMWEHSYVADYQPSGKKQYIEDYFANLNWEVIGENFKRAKK